jgi:hypothetical protein
MTTLQVTQADINESRNRRTASTLDRQRATYNSEQDCPIGIALARTFETDRKHILANPDALRVTTGERRHMPIVDSYGRKCGTVYEQPTHSFEATQVIRDFMRSWDRRGHAEPHNFKLVSR